MKLTLIKDLKKEFGDKNCTSKTFDCSPYVLLDKKSGETVEGKLLDSKRVKLIYGGATFVVDKSYFSDFNQSSIPSTSSTDAPVSENIDVKKSKKGMYIGIGIGVIAIGVITFLIIKNRN